jgi:hypothetical protein
MLLPKARMTASGASLGSVAESSLHAETSAAHDHRTIPEIRHATLR